jgi:hypothetical protein
MISLSTPYNGRLSSDRSSQKREYNQLLHDIPSTGRSLLGVSFITSLRSNLCASLATQITTRTNYVVRHIQNTTAFHPSLFCNLKMRVTGHTQGSVGSPVKQLPRSNANSSVSVGRTTWRFSTTDAKPAIGHYPVQGSFTSHLPSQRSVFVILRSYRFLRGFRP